MSIQEYQNGFQQFRQSLYQNFDKRADTAIELVDALCSYPAATSVVELSLASVFRLSYTALYKALDEVAWEDISVAELLGEDLPRPKARGFWLLAVDVTSQPRSFARTLSDRGYVYQPNAVAGNKPVTIGHQYSTVVLLPEKETGLTSSWVVPMSTQRVATTADKELVGADQVRTLLADEGLPWHDELIVEMVAARISSISSDSVNRSCYSRHIKRLRRNGKRSGGTWCTSPMICCGQPAIWHITYRALGSSTCPPPSSKKSRQV